MFQICNQISITITLQVKECETDGWKQDRNDWTDGSWDRQGETGAGEVKQQGSNIVSYKQNL